MHARVMPPSSRRLRLRLCFDHMAQPILVQQLPHHLGLQKVFATFERVAVMALTQDCFNAHKTFRRWRIHGGHTAVGGHHHLGKPPAVQHRLAAGHLHCPKIFFKFGDSQWMWVGAQGALRGAADDINFKTRCIDCCVFLVITQDKGFVHLLEDSQKRCVQALHGGGKTEVLAGVQ